VNDLKIAFRAPWYERKRGKSTVNDSRSLRPVIQKYDDTNFVNRLLTDPQDSLEFTTEDLWSYPVPVTFPAPGTGRQRFATSRLVTTKLRKLYQPSHQRFYAVVVELFCDTPGLPTAGKHDDLTVELVVRRRDTTVFGQPSDVRKLARALMLTMLHDEDAALTFDKIVGSDTLDVKRLKHGRIADREDLWFGSELARLRFEEDKKPLLEAVTAHTTDQKWLTNAVTGAGRWVTVATAPAKDEDEQRSPMWRLGPEQCDPGHTRSLWFGVIPTYSADHWIDPAKGDRSVPKFDERSIYEIVCIATQKQPPGREHCAKSWESVASEPFRFAAPYDPDGTKNRRVSISVPDLRRLAARAGRPAGPGGLSISTPPGSQFIFSADGFPTIKGSLGIGGGVCTFAFELFFIVALFLFLMFLPIVVLAFQLWWLLALRFCFPRIDASMSALATFFATAGGKGMANLDTDLSAEADLDAVLGSSGIGAKLQFAATPAGGDKFPNTNAMAQAFVDMVDPNGAVQSDPQTTLKHVDDPLCPKP
jgi:hypothetical protein